MIHKHVDIQLCSHTGDQTCHKNKHCVVFIEAAKLLLRSGIKTSSLKGEAKGLCFSSPGLTSLGWETEVQLKQEQEQVLRGLKENSAGADWVDPCSECSDRKKSESPVYYKHRTGRRVKTPEFGISYTENTANSQSKSNFSKLWSKHIPARNMSRVTFVFV